MDRFDRNFHRFSLWPSLACPATRWVVRTSLVYNLKVFVSIDKLSYFEESQRSTSSRTPSAIKTVDILRVRVSKSRFWCRFWSRSCVLSVSTDSKKKLKRKADRRRPRRLNRLDRKTPKAWTLATEGVRNLTCTILLRFSSWICACLLKHAFAMRIYRDDRENTWRWGVRFFYQQLEARTHRRP